MRQIDDCRKDGVDKVIETAYDRRLRLLVLQRSNSSIAIGVYSHPLMIKAALA